MPSRPRSRHHAFTLIELLVVVAIVALISSMITGAVLAVRESSRVQEATTRVDELQMAIESYLIEEPVPIDPEDGNDGSGYLVDSEVAGGPSLLRQLVHKRLFSYTHSRDLDRQGRLLDPWGQPWLLIIGTGADPHGHVPSDLADSVLDDWQVANGRAAPEQRIYIYSYGSDNPDGQRHQDWIHPTAK